tara:strand:+ start:1479 stop:1805 length:327 start_codon:yes stop_codon:yes gene_type:complete
LYLCIIAPKKKPYSQLSASAKFYRNSKKARKVKAAKDKEINCRPEQKKKRAELSKARRRRGIEGKGGLDLSHTKNGLRLKSVKANRGSSSDSQGDKNARAKKKKIVKK